MRLKPAAFAAVLALFSLPALAQEPGSFPTPGFSLNFTGNVQKDATGNGIRDTATTSGGFLMNYRRSFRFLPRHGYLQGNGGFTTFTQYYSPGGSQTQANIYEGTISYIMPFLTNNTRHLKPFLELGAGVEWFSVVGSGSVTGAQKEFQPAGVYGVGVDWGRGSHFFLRLGYRGLLYPAPDFGQPAQVTNAITHMAEPFIGIAYKF